MDESGNRLPLGPVRMKLPFLCDRALVMLRGFKLQFFDENPHEISVVNASVRLQTYGWGIARVEPGGDVVLEPTGALNSTEPIKARRNDSTDHRFNMT